MMVFLPLGHDKGIFRFPWVTVGIIALCLVFQIYNAFHTVDEDEAKLLMEEQQLTIQQLFRKHGHRWIKQKHPEKLKDPESYLAVRQTMMRDNRRVREFLKDFEAGKVVPKTHPDYQRVEAFVAKVKGSAGLLYTCGYTQSAKPWTLVSYMFMHGGWLHLIMNMLFLYLCGCNMEDRWGRIVWLALYLGGGVAAALTWSGVNPGSESPLVGASGAIAAAMGAFLITNYKAEIRIGYFIMVMLRPIYGVWEMKAYWAVPLWLIGQFLGLATEGHHAETVAYSAHVGGFVMGAAVALVMRLIGVDRRLKTASEDRATVFSQDSVFVEGLEQLERGDHAAALSAFEAMLRKDPGHLDAAMEIYRLQKDPTEAVQAANQALVLAKRSGDMITPLTIYADVNQRHPGAPWDDRTLFAVAECFEHKGDVNAAVTVYEKLVALHPDSPVAPKALLNIAAAFAKSFNQKERARQALEQILEMYPGSPFADKAMEMLGQLPASIMELDPKEDPPL
jgi:membrane associated rhomboid family serine protease